MIDNDNLVSNETSEDRGNTEIIVSSKRPLNSFAYLLTQYSWVSFLCVFIASGFIFPRIHPGQIFASCEYPQTSSFGDFQDPLIITHSTDIHLSFAEPFKIVNTRALIHSLKFYRADFNLISGDMVDSYGEKNWPKIGKQVQGDWDLWRRLIEEELSDIPFPIIDLAGNHDMWGIDEALSEHNLFLDYSYTFNRNNTKKIEDFYVKTVFMKGQTFVLINPYKFPSIHPPYIYWAHPSKLVLDCIEAEFKHLKNDLKIKKFFVVCHYPVDHNWWIRSSKGKTYEEIMQDESIIAYFTGHFHPLNAQIIHHKHGAVEYIGPGAFQFKAFGVVTIDKGSMVYHNVHLTEPPNNCLLTNPVPRDQISGHQVFGESEGELHLVYYPTYFNNFSEITQAQIQAQIHAQAQEDAKAKVNNGDKAKEGEQMKEESSGKLLINNKQPRIDDEKVRGLNFQVNGSVSGKMKFARVLPNGALLFTLPYRIEREGAHTLQILGEKCNLTRDFFVGKRFKSEGEEAACYQRGLLVTKIAAIPIFIFLFWIICPIGSQRKGKLFLVTKEAESWIFGNAEQRVADDHDELLRSASKPDDSIGNGFDVDIGIEKTENLNNINNIENEDKINNKINDKIQNIEVKIANNDESDDGGIGGDENGMNIIEKEEENNNHKRNHIKKSNTIFEGNDVNSGSSGMSFMKYIILILLSPCILRYRMAKLPKNIRYIMFFCLLYPLILPIHFFKPIYGLYGWSFLCFVFIGKKIFYDEWALHMTWFFMVVIMIPATMLVTSNKLYIINHWIFKLNLFVAISLLFGICVVNYRWVGESVKVINLFLNPTFVIIPVIMYTNFYIYLFKNKSGMEKSESVDILVPIY